MAIAFNTDPSASPHKLHRGKTLLTIEQLRELVALQAEDEALWRPATHIETAYAQQCLRYLTHAIEGDWTFDEARAVIQDCLQ